MYHAGRVYNICSARNNIRLDNKRQIKESVTNNNKRRYDIKFSEF
jgi:hypothetical protein